MSETIAKALEAGSQIPDTPAPAAKPDRGDEYTPAPVEPVLVETEAKPEHSGSEDPAAAWEPRL